ncbi:MAG: methylenetetrahydrofolate--tRNA-(uracil(54)-C(5))-methyltransferase (FADH(2)-oxidizing) TrmFO [Ruminococcaceae bacterium]|nr:methylenetetrahydrofolate--tRNA-(uracil(54)-C(5))-methyltransferase (FADH(2)-oxidizing) TrmFO [Oscillospiraceae bacterium]
MRSAYVIGAGLAGCEAASFLAKSGYAVTLFEQKPEKKSAAHKLDSFAELVCSNSLKAARPDSAAGLLKAEMRLMGSVCLEVADRCSVPAGGALAVDRYAFSSGVTEKIKANPNIKIVYGEITEIDESVPTVVATGPLTEGGLASNLQALCGGQGYLSFYDAAAPIISADSIDMSRVYSASRYENETEGDYLNCYFDKAGYESFMEALVNAETAELHDADKDYAVYEGCMPIEKLAKRSANAARFGMMKPVGLINPETGHRPWAAVQLRKENEGGTMYNLVGFQTNLKFGEQKRVFSMIPGLENAEFVRYGVMHRNSFLNSPEVLNISLNLRKSPNVFVGGQLTGFEGYMESAASGLLAARFLKRRDEGKGELIPSENTMCGALLRYITAPNKSFQPLGANMGVLPPLLELIKDKRKKYEALSERALSDMRRYIGEDNN